MVLQIAGRALGTSLVPKLLTPGVLHALLLLSALAAAELLLQDRLFQCPCSPGLAIAYGLAFLVMPGLALFLADFPWKLVADKGCARPGVLASMARRPFFFMLIWLVLALMDHRHVDCLAKGSQGVNSCSWDDQSLAPIFQLVALAFWLLLVIIAVVLTVCRRKLGRCRKGRSRLLEVVTLYDMEQARYTATIVNRIGSKEIHPRLSREELLALEPGLSTWTMGLLEDLGLSSRRVLGALEEVDLQELRLPMAQRVLVRGLAASLRAAQAKADSLDSRPPAPLPPDAAAAHNGKGLP